MARAQKEGLGCHERSTQQLRATPQDQRRHRTPRGHAEDDQYRAAEACYLSVAMSFRHAPGVTASIVRASSPKWPCLVSLIITLRALSVTSTHDPPVALL